MKLLIESWRRYLQEIGDAALGAYDFESVFSGEEEVWYNFNSSAGDPALGSDYVVKFTTGGPAVGDDAWDISFEANETVQTTDEGQPLKIMATVVAIVKDYIDRSELNRGMRKFVFMGVGKADEEGPERTSRTKMYMRLLKKNMINQVITPTKKKNAQTKLPGWKRLKTNYKGSAPPGAGGS